MQERPPRDGAPARRRAAPARHLPAAQPVHHRGAVRRLLRHRAGDERPLRGSPRSPSSSPMLLDGLDGRVARLTHTQSEFGAEYDSLSDMVSFGAAPALVMYEWALKDLGKLRLDRRFRLLRGRGAAPGALQHQHRRGRQALLPGAAQPGGGGAGGGLRLGGRTTTGSRATTVAAMGRLACSTLFAGITMVTNVPFYSFKEINFGRAVPFWVVLLIVLGFVLVSSTRRSCCSCCSAPTACRATCCGAWASAAKDRILDGGARDTGYSASHASGHSRRPPLPGASCAGRPAAAPRALNSNPTIR